jgi:hypothetical protein
MRHLSGFCHADGSWCRIDRAGCAAIADVVEIAVSAIDRFWPEFEEPVRFLRKQPGFSKFDASIAPPEVAPAPITVWISSMNMIAPG